MLDVKIRSNTKRLLRFADCFQIVYRVIASLLATNQSMQITH